VQAEFILKVSAFGWAEYWNDPWNRFDMSIVIVSTVDALASALGPSGNLRVLAILRLQKLSRLLRISRLVKALKFLHSLTNLIKALAQVSEILAQVGAILCLLLFVFGYWGVLLFGKVRRTRYVVRLCT
jgi:hypothetical protein